MAHRRGFQLQAPENPIGQCRWRVRRTPGQTCLRLWQRGEKPTSDECLPKCRTWGSTTWASQAGQGPRLPGQRLRVRHLAQELGGNGPRGRLLVEATLCPHIGVRGGSVLSEKRQGGHQGCSQAHLPFGSGLKTRHPSLWSVLGPRWPGALSIRLRTRRHSLGVTSVHMDSDRQPGLSVWPQAPRPEFTCVSKENVCARRTRRCSRLCPGVSTCLPPPSLPRAPPAGSIPNEGPWARDCGGSWSSSCCPLTQ